MNLVRIFTTCGFSLEVYTMRMFDVERVRAALQAQEKLRDDGREITRETSFDVGEKRILVTTGYRPSGTSNAYSYNFRLVDIQQVDKAGKGIRIIGLENRKYIDFNDREDVRIHLKALLPASLLASVRPLTDVYYPSDGEMRTDHGITGYVPEFANEVMRSRFINSLYHYEDLVRDFPKIDIEATVHALLEQLQGRNLRVPRLILPQIVE